jgi:hypothetical protein
MQKIDFILKDPLDEDFLESCSIDFASMTIRTTSEVILPPASLDTPFGDSQILYSFFLVSGRVRLQWEGDNSLGFWNNDPLKSTLESVRLFKGSNGSSPLIYSLLQQQLQIHSLRSLPRDENGFGRFWDSFYSEVCRSEETQRIFLVESERFLLDRPCRLPIEKVSEKLILHSLSNRWEQVRDLLDRLKRADSSDIASCVFQ